MLKPYSSLLGCPAKKERIGAIVSLRVECCLACIIPWVHPQCHEAKEESRFLKEKHDLKRSLSVMSFF